MHKKTYLFLASSWTVFITVLSLVNLGGLGSTVKIPYKDKMVHFVFYFLFYILWYSFFKFKNNFPKLKWMVLFLAIGYGVAMEILQGTMHNHRSPDTVDVFANSLGAVFGLLLAPLFISKKKDI